jgi:hypothetical protein
MEYFFVLILFWVCVIVGLHFGSKVYKSSKRPRIQRLALAAAFFFAGLVIPPLSLVLFIVVFQWFGPGSKEKPDLNCSRPARVCNESGTNCIETLPRSPLTAIRRA